jgi:uncharacterized protein (DUF1499 family)
MSSKQLDSILSKIPSATVEGERKNTNNLEINKINYYQQPSNIIEETDRIVAVIPKILKQEIRDYLKAHKGDTEKIIILKALKLMGFKVPEEWLIDKRSTR